MRICSTLRLSTLVFLSLSLSACQPLNEAPTAPAMVDDGVNDPRADLPGFGGQDPGTGLVVPEHEACGWTRAQTQGNDQPFVMSWTVTTDALGRRATQRQIYQDEVIIEWRYTYGPAGLETIHVDNRGYTYTLSFQWHEGLLTSIARVDEHGLERWIYAYDDDGDLSEMEYWGAYDEDEPTTRVEYRWADGRLVGKRVWRRGPSVIDVAYRYDAEGRMVVKTLTRDEEAPVEEYYEWGPNGVTEISRKISTMRYTTYDGAGRVADVRRWDDTRSPTEITTFSYDCD